MEELLTLPGVGRKTANLVLILAHRSAENICVDTHVHRISNRMGWVRTRTPDETEQALYAARGAHVVARHQPVSRDVGAERLPAGLPAVRRLRDSRPVPSNGRDKGREGMRLRSAAAVAALAACALLAAPLAAAAGFAGRAAGDRGP